MNIPAETKIGLFAILFAAFSALLEPRLSAVLAMFLLVAFSICMLVNTQRSP